MITQILVLAILIITLHDIYVESFNFNKLSHVIPHAKETYARLPFLVHDVLRKRNLAIVSSCIVFALATPTTPCLAAPSENVPARIYISGKSQKEVNKNDNTGTKKDSKFLRCLSNCKSKCQLPSEGYAMERVDCVQDCQGCLSLLSFNFFITEIMII
jgi:hypothetical protein